MDMKTLVHDICQEKQRNSINNTEQDFHPYSQPQWFSCVGTPFVLVRGVRPSLSVGKKAQYSVKEVQMSVICSYWTKVHITSITVTCNCLNRLHICIYGVHRSSCRFNSPPLVFFLTVNRPLPFSLNAAPPAFPQLSLKCSVSPQHISTLSSFSSSVASVSVPRSPLWCPVIFSLLLDADIWPVHPFFGDLVNILTHFHELSRSYFVDQKCPFILKKDISGSMLVLLFVFAVLRNLTIIDLGGADEPLGLVWDNVWMFIFGGSFSVCWAALSQIWLYPSFHLPLGSGRECD